MQLPIRARYGHFLLKGQHLRDRSQRIIKPMQRQNLGLDRLILRIARRAQLAVKTDRTFQVGASSG